MKKYAAALAVAVLLSFAAFSSPIKVWLMGDSLTSADLNANFAHIHNLMVGGHGGRLVNADVSSSAAIQYSKMESTSPVAKMWGQLDCSGSSCTVVDGYNVASVSGNPYSGGVYVFYSGLTVHMMQPVLSTNGVVCNIASRANNSFRILCAAGAVSISFVAFSS